MSEIPHDILQRIQDAQGYVTLGFRTPKLIGHVISGVNISESRQDNVTAVVVAQGTYAEWHAQQVRFRGTVPDRKAGDFYYRVVAG